MGRVVESWSVLELMLEPHRKHGDVIVSTNGVFDLLHVGHIRYLRAARNLGDLLVVGINSDSSTSALKGSGRPFIPESERAELIAALESVSYVTLFNESTPERLLEMIRPTIHVKGGDYSAEDLPESAIVEMHGGRVEVIPYVPGRSTTALAAHILETAHPQSA